MGNARRAQLCRTRKARSDTPRLEWMLGVLGMLLLGSGVAFLVHQGLSDADGPGAVTASVIEVRETSGAYIVRFAVHNSGGETLSQLQLAARLTDGEEEVERAQTTIEYLPGRSTREGGFYLRNDPRRYALEIRPEGYAKP